MPAVDFDMMDDTIHPVPAWRFWLTLPDIAGVSQRGDVCGLLCQKFVASHRGIDYETVPFQAGVRNFPTSFHTEALSAVFVENNGWDAFLYVKEWLDIIVDGRGVFGLPSVWKQPIQIDSLDHAGQLLYSHVYKGCAPVRPDPHDYDGTSTHYHPTSCTFTTDGYDTQTSSLGYSVSASGAVSGVAGNFLGGFAGF